MAIYDCFQYFDEDHMVDLRLNILNKYVNYFVISESTKTHQGRNKKINFDIKKIISFGTLATDFSVNDLQLLRGFQSEYVSTKLLLEKAHKVQNKVVCCDIF